jgi:PAS domain S-box-containing protein
MLRVLIVDDDESIRDVLVDVMAAARDLEAVGTARDAIEGIQMARQTQPDVAVVDVRMSEGGGRRAIEGILEHVPGCSVLALSAFEERQTVLDMLLAGASGYIVKGASASEIVEAVRRAARHQVSLSVDMLANLIESLVLEVTEQRRSNDELRRSDERFRALLESAPDAAVIINADGQIVLVNEQAEHMFGHPREVTVGRPAEMLVPERLRTDFNRHREHSLANPGTRPEGLELLGLRADDTEFLADIALSSVETDEGRLTAAFIRNVTKRALAEDVLRQSEERFRDLLESAPDAVVVAEEGGRIVLVNKRTEEMFGHRREDIVGEQIEYLLPERFREHVGHRGDYPSDPQTRPMGVGLRSDGFEFPVDISLASLDRPDGSFVIAFVRDMTARERAFRELQDLQDTLREDEGRRQLAERLVRAQEEERVRIAGDVHDDSVQVMTAALMRLQILQDQLHEPAQLALLARLEETVQECIKRLRRLLFVLHPRALDTEGLVPTLRTYLQDLGREASMVVRLQDELSQEPAPDVRATVYRIAQEAVTNVMKHANAGLLEVGLRTSKGGVRLSVRDDGRGLTEDVIDLRQGHIGLTTMRERAEMAGGWLQIESRPDAGTSILAWIPDPESGGGDDTGPAGRNVRTTDPTSVGS